MEDLEVKIDLSTKDNKPIIMYRIENAKDGSLIGIAPSEERAKTKQHEFLKKGIDTYIIKYETY